MFRILFFLIIFLLVILFPIYAVIKVFSSEMNSTDKLIWFLVILFFPFLGALAYFVFGNK